MFDHTCSSCGKHRLVFPGQVTSVTNTETGIVITYSCWCGADQTWVTGRRGADRAPRHATPTAA